MESGEVFLGHLEGSRGQDLVQSQGEEFLRREPGQQLDCGAGIGYVLVQVHPPDDIPGILGQEAVLGFALPEGLLHLAARGDIPGDAGGADDLLFVVQYRGFDGLNPNCPLFGICQGFLEAFPVSGAHDLLVIGPVFFRQVERPDIQVVLAHHLLEGDPGRPWQKAH